MKSNDFINHMIFSEFNFQLQKLATFAQYFINNDRKQHDFGNRFRPWWI